MKETVVLVRKTGSLYKKNTVMIRRIVRPPRIPERFRPRNVDYRPGRFYIALVLIALIAGAVGGVIAVVIARYLGQPSHPNQDDWLRMPPGESIIFSAVLALVLCLVLGIFFRGWRAKLVVGAKLTWACAQLLLAFALILLAVLVLDRLSAKTEGVSILTFDNDTGETKYNGGAIAASLKVELLRIEQILSTPHKDLGSEQSETMKSTPIDESGEKLNESLKDIGTVGVGEAKLSLGALLVAAKRLWPFGDPGIVISGSLQKFGSQIRLTAFLEHEDKVHGFEVTRQIKSDDDITQMVRDMAFKLAKSAPLEDPGHPILAKTLVAFQDFTEALNCYDGFITTGDISELRQAKTFCIAAVKAEQNYNIVAPLLKNLGVFFYQRSEPKESVELFEQATALNPTDIDAWNYLGLAFADTEELGPAERAFQKAKNLTAEPDSANLSYYLNLGYALISVNRFNEAEKQYRLAISLSPQTVTGHLGLGDCLFAEGDHAGARTEYETALSCDQSSVLANLRVGDMDFEAGRYDDALAKYNDALKSDKRSATALCSIGDIYLARNQVDWAESYYDEVAEIAPSFTAAHVRLSSCSLTKGEYERASKELEKAMESDPWDAWPRSVLGDLHLMRGELEAALKEYQRAIDLRPRYLDPYLGIADTFRIAGNYREAEAKCREALELWKSNPNAYCCLGRIFLDQNRYRESLAAFQKAVELRPATPDGYVGCGDVFQNQDEYKWAMTEYDLALGIQPNDYDAHCGKAAILLKQGKFTEAIAEDKRAADINPGAFYAYLGIGDAYYWQARYELAEEEYDRAKRISPNNSAVNANLGDIAKHKQNYQEANDRYLAAVGSAPLPVCAWTELTWLNLKNRAFEKAKTYLEKALDIDQSYSGSGLAAGAILYLQGHVGDAERIWKDKLKTCRFRSPVSRVDEIILLYAAGDRAGAKNALNHLMDESQEPPIGVLRDSLFYVDILNSSGSHRFSSLQQMLSIAGKSVSTK